MKKLRHSGVFEPDGTSFIALRDRPEWKAPAAAWFHEKWGVPTEAYLECMTAYL